LLADPPPAVSFMFGCPRAEVIAALGDAGSVVAVTVTSPGEAVIAAVTGLPQIAAGGIMGPRQVDAVLAAGAVAAQCGTAFLRCPESGAHPVHKAALADPRYTATALTRAFSGRWARGLVNRFVLDHTDAPAAYPEINNATRPLRAAAAAKGDPERMSLWAGQGYRSATDRPAGEIIERLCARTRS
jgi:nitronate monooxygenase